ncbi:MAG: hypothetical protein RML95_01525 [Anaerolineae bacterium]|nr:hypothetical protein [Anaerolineae bacterium]MDW8297994.1 hypothetical protein [Anaerolineae bacterium]
MSQSAEEPKSLLRRLLRRPDDLPQPPEPTAAPASEPAVSASPVRPSPPESGTPPAPILPNVRSTQSAPAAQSAATLQERLRAELALEKLRQKTARVSAEFASGKINRAQFLALYAHYNEKRIIIERLLERNPDTQAWQSVANSGQTSFLRAHFASRVLSYAIYFHDSTQPLIAEGQPFLPEDIAFKILMAIRIVRRTHQTLSAQRKQVDENHWAVFIPAEFTTAIVMFWLEPSTRQIVLVQDLHQDFERANRTLLTRSVRTAEHYVFPHRALFEETL